MRIEPDHVIDTVNLRDTAMDEGIERDNTSGGGGLPTLPGLNLSTIQPLQRGFYRIHVCEGEDNWRQYI